MLLISYNSADEVLSKGIGDGEHIGTVVTSVLSNRLNSGES